MDEIVEWVYWAVPSGIVPNMVSALSMDTNGMVVMSVAQGTELLGADVVSVYGWNFAKQYTVAVTEQGYLNWYNSNQTAIATSKNFNDFNNIYNIITQPNSTWGGTYTTGIQGNANYLKEENYYWISFGGLNVGNYNNLAGAPPSQQYKITANQLYALIKSTSQAATITPGVSYGGPGVSTTITPQQSTQQGVTSAQWSQQTAQQTAQWGAQNVANNTQSIITDINKEIVTLETDIGGAGNWLKNSAQGINNDLTNLNKFLQVLPWVMVAGGVILVVAFAWSVSRSSAGSTLEGAGKGVGHAVGGAATLAAV